MMWLSSKDSYQYALLKVAQQVSSRRRCGQVYRRAANDHLL
jgi:hypothetical protein